MEHKAYKKRQRELGLFSLEKIKGDFVVLNYLVAQCRENRARFFSEVNWDRVRDDGSGQPWKILIGYNNFHCGECFL